MKVGTGRGDEPRVKLTDLKRSYRAQPYLLWEVPLQALGLRHGRVRVPLTVAICGISQLEALCGQGEL